MPHEFLETERLLMRPLTASDKADVASIVGDAETATPDVREAVEHWRSHGFGPFAAVERASGGFVGVIELHFAGDGLIGIEPDEVEIGWVIDSTRRGEGLASEGAATVLASGLDLADHVVAYIGLCNDRRSASQRKSGCGTSATVGHVTATRSGSMSLGDATLRRHPDSRAPRSN
jgi:RimJ/RimL family protein N-acetyltransferase